jgi:predicted ArsR family transcriptional regulator
MSTLGDAKRRIVDILKTVGPSTAAAIAAALDVTNVAVRQHLSALESAGLVRQQPASASGRGRPALLWSLTDAAYRLFPDHHGALTVELIGAMRNALGEQGLDQVIEARARDQVGRYRAMLPGGRASLKSRVEALAEQRSREGYMADVEQQRGGVYLLVENHCPICEAAESCTGLCRSELDVFQEALGPDAIVERTEHLLSGDRRCAYRITRAKRQN